MADRKRYLERLRDLGCAGDQRRRGVRVPPPTTRTGQDLAERQICLIRKMKSLFSENRSLFRGAKFPVLGRREFGVKPENRWGFFGGKNLLAA
jgi:hypothetical protein